MDWSKGGRGSEVSQLAEFCRRLTGAWTGVKMLGMGKWAHTSDVFGENSWQGLIMECGAGERGETR